MDTEKNDDKLSSKEAFNLIEKNIRTYLFPSFGITNEDIAEYKKKEKKRKKEKNIHSK